jgi:hypothetical protein
MTVPMRAEQQPQQAPQPAPVVRHETAAYCGACAGWMGTVPAGTPWFSGRCINKRCPKYAEPQRIKTM